jgi:hypothetical protein
LDFPLPRYESCDNWNNLTGKIATHQKTVSVTRSVDCQMEEDVEEEEPLAQERKK